MSNLERSLAELRPQLAPRWTVEREQAISRSMALARRKRRRTRALVVAASIVLIAAGVGSRLVAREPTLADVNITRVGQDTTLELLSLDDGEAHVALQRGGAWLDASNQQARKVSIDVDTVEVRFDRSRVLVEKIASGVRVFVEQGAAEVRWPGGSARLGPGDNGSFPPAPPSLPPASRPEPNIIPTSSELAVERPAVAEAEPAPKRAPTLRPAEPPALALPTPEPSPEVDSRTPEIPTPAPVVDVPGSLLQQADASRARGRPAEAVAPLQRLMDEFPDDARAPLAAFTLGRVLLESLARPADAADAFAKTRQLAPSSVLFEDALAREVEARSRASQPERAKALAEEYAQRFPQGGRLETVRRFGGLQPGGAASTRGLK